MKKLIISAALLLVTLSAFAGPGFESDLQAGFTLAAQRESYTESKIDFTNHTNRIGFEIANFNIVEDRWYGFFENMDFLFYRWGTSDGQVKITYNDASFFAFSMMMGPAFRIKGPNGMETRIGAGLHYMLQSWTSSDDYTYHDSNIGIGAVIDCKFFKYEQFSLILGVKAYYDPANSKSYVKNDTAYSIKTSNYSLMGIEPHILFCWNIN